MLFSIIVPVYKVEKYLRKCIESILNQTYKDFELILVDDGSPDKSGEICDEYAKQDERIKVIHKQNGGLISARRAGFKIARGEYVCFVDSDDYVDGDFLLNFFEIAQKYKPQVIAIDCVRFCEDEQETIINHTQEGFYADESLKSLKQKLIYNSELEGLNLGAILFSICSKASRREFLEKHLFLVDERIVMGEDMAISMPFIAECSSIYVKKYAGYYYRNTPNSIVNSYRENDFQDAKGLIKYLDEKMPNHYEQLSYYLLYRMIAFISETAKAKKYSAYKSMLKNNFSSFEFERINLVKLKKLQPKKQIFYSLIKRKQWLFIWLYLRIKNIDS